jgi:formimidoylglutamate deiminase
LRATDNGTLMDRFVFGGATGAVRDVIVGGRWVVHEHCHVAQDAIERRYRKAVDELFT